MSLYNQIAGQRIQRIEALSDGLFSIAMTILVFDLKDPVSSALTSEAELWAGLSGMLPKLLTYFMSFMTLGIFWAGHSTQFHYIRQSDRNLLWYSLFFLLFVSLVPFSTIVLSGHITNRVSIGVYWVNIFALGASLYLHWNYAAHHGLLDIPEAERKTVDRAVRKRIIVAQTLYAFGALLCLVNNYLSIAVILAIQLNYALGLFDGSKRRS